MVTYTSSEKDNVLFYLNKKSVLNAKIKNDNVKKEYIEIGDFSYLNLFKVNKVAKVLKNSSVNVIVINPSQDMKFASFAAKKAGIKNIIYKEEVQFLLRIHL